MTNELVFFQLLIIAHVIQPPNCKTLKTFGAALCLGWIIYDPNWVLESAKRGVWLDESTYGFKLDVNPFYSKRVYMTDGFRSCVNTNKFRVDFVKTLIGLCSDGTLVDDPKEAIDYVLCGDSEDATQLKLGGLHNAKNWNAFIDMIGLPSKF